MKVLLFFTTFRQFEENKHQVTVLNKQNNLPEGVIIDIILHNNNSAYNYDMIRESFDIDKLKENRFINDVKIIHTDKNIGYLWGAQEALNDNFDTFMNYDYVIHLNTDVYMCNLVKIMEYMKEQLATEYTFFVNKFRNEGYKTDFCFFKPTCNVYQYYNSERTKSKLKPRAIPESLLEYSIKVNNVKYILLPETFIPVKDPKNDININMKYVYHIHDLKNSIPFIVKN